MGANLILACVVVPRCFVGSMLEAEMTRRVNLMDDDQLRSVAVRLADIEGEEEVWDYAVDDASDIMEYPDDFGEIVFDLEKVRKRILQAVRVVCKGGAESTDLGFGNVVMRITGGPTWGDSPSDDYDDYCIVEEADLFKRELNALCRRMDEKTVVPDSSDPEVLDYRIDPPVDPTGSETPRVWFGLHGPKPVSVGIRSTDAGVSVLVLGSTDAELGVLDIPWDEIE